MSDPLDIVVECDSPARVWSVLRHINNNQLPRGLRKPFGDLIVSWISQLPEDEVLSLIRGKTVRQILSEYSSEPLPKPLESGEKDGVKWALYDPPADTAG
jgi:hypothetical protein